MLHDQLNDYTTMIILSEVMGKSEEQQRELDDDDDDDSSVTGASQCVAS